MRCASLVSLPASTSAGLDEPVLCAPEVQKCQRECAPPDTRPADQPRYRQHPLLQGCGIPLATGSVNYHHTPPRPACSSLTLARYDSHLHSLNDIPKGLEAAP